MIPPLYYFNEEGGSILSVLRKDLEQVPVIVVVYEDVQLLQDINTFSYSNFALLELFTDQRIVF